MSASPVIPTPLTVRQLHLLKRLLVYIARKHRSLWSALESRGVEADDIEQQCWLGAMRAAQLFDPSFGCSFTTYALSHARASVQRLLQIRVGYPHPREIASLDMAVGGRFGDPNALAVLCPMQAERDHFETREIAERMLAELDDREAEIVRQRLDGATFAKLATAHGISKERARQIEMKAVEKLRKLFCEVQV